MDHANTALHQYNAVGMETAVDAAGAHRLIEMLLQGALDRIAAAKGYMMRGEIANKGGSISRTLSIIDGLRMGLDKQAGGEMAQNLDDLYEYMGHRLVQANFKNDPALLDEVASLLREIKSAWIAIPDGIKAAR